VTSRILSVCTANVCRSPMVEVMLAERLDPERFRVESAGVRAAVGRAMDPDSARQLEERGLAVPTGGARQLTPEILAGADLVLTATRAHRAEVLDLYPRALRRTFTLREFAALTGLVESDDLAGLVARAAEARTQGPRDVDLTDPIGRPVEVHEEVAAIADRATATIADRLNALGGSAAAV